MAAQFIFTMHKVGRFIPPDRDVLKDITLSFYPGAKIGVLGPNGAGKSTLLRIMAGIDQDFTGDARLTDGFTVGMLEQEPHLDPAKDVMGNVMDGVGEVAGLLQEYDQVLAGWSDPDADYEKLGARQADLESRIEAAGAWDLQRNVEIAMDALRTPAGDTPVDNLSGGEARRVAMARLLLSKPDLLLLDEPTNHLDAESVAWLERTLQDYQGTVVAITHDRYFLDNVAGWILELDRGRGMPFEGNYSGFLEQKEARYAQEQKDDDKRTRTLKRELEWVRMAPKARQAKGKARLQQYEKLLEEQKHAEGRLNDLEIVIPADTRLGDLVIEAEGISKGFGDKLLIDDLSFSLPPAGIVGVIGANGAGKSTLFKMIIAAAEQNGDADAAPDQGALRIGPTVTLGYVDQDRTLDPDKTVYEEITGGVDNLTIGGREMHGRAYVASFNFRGSDQQGGRQRPAARRADQRPRRRHPAGPGGRRGGLRRLCGHHQPRSLVPRSRGHPHPGLRGRLAGPLVRGQLHRLRRVPKARARRRRHAPPAHQVQARLPPLTRHTRYSGVRHPLPGPARLRRTPKDLGMRSDGSPWQRPRRRPQPRRCGRAVRSPA